MTKNAAYSWQAAVQESVDATLNRTVSSGKALTTNMLLPHLGLLTLMQAGQHCTMLTVCLRRQGLHHATGMLASSSIRGFCILGNTASMSLLC